MNSFDSNPNPSSNAELKNPPAIKILEIDFSSSDLKKSRFYKYTNKAVSVCDLDSDWLQTSSDVKSCRYEVWSFLSFPPSTRGDNVKIWVSLSNKTYKCKFFIMTIFDMLITSNQLSITRIDQISRWVLSHNLNFL